MLATCPSKILPLWLSQISPIYYVPTYHELYVCKCACMNSISVHEEGRESGGGSGQCSDGTHEQD